MCIERGIKEIEQLVESYYNDKRTAYIFTSDHGMTDWGMVFDCIKLIYHLIIRSIYNGYVHIM